MPSEAPTLRTCRFYFISNKKKCFTRIRSKRSC
uniref:Cell division cycle 16 homolog n=1 Tax=Nothobranchius kadleci TaxID=1051664 RepID=A0A1A8BHV0_NOTKA